MAGTDHELKVWLDGQRVAELIPAKASGHVLCRYTDEALDIWPRNSPVISCSLPLDDKSREATAFFRGLLPEGDALRRMAEKADLTTTDTFGLLNQYGRDVAGALVITAEVPDKSRFDLEVLDEDRLAATIDELEDNPLGAVDESELSLAGMQDKLLLVKRGSAWARPLRGMPSTHILKVNDWRHPGLVEAEGHCLVLARSVGLTTVDVEFMKSGGRDCLIVSRYDRQIEDGRVTRVHQEDVCQALGIDPVINQRAKYEAHGGPGFREVARLLDEYADDVESELDRLIRVVTFTVLIGNADAHGKNLSLLHRDPETVTLAPLYDTVPTALWPNLRSTGAMVIGAQPELADVTISAIGREARRWNHPENHAKQVAAELARNIQDALADGVIPEGHPTSRYVKKRAARLLSE